MPVLRIEMTAGDGPLDPDASTELRFELEREVGPLEESRTPTANAKGGAADFATVAVAVLSSQAVTALVGVLKARIERDPKSEIVVKGPGGEVQIRSGDNKLLHSGYLHRLIETVLGGKPRGEANAPGSADSGEPV
jgi:hypothetical protein